MQQRTAIARALANGPRMLLMAELTESVRAEVRQAQQQTQQR
jgi:ABC-type taurine transport system ATPase subunit